MTIEPDATAVARALAAMRKPVTATCAFCGQDFEAIKTRRLPRFCCNAHKSADYRRRKRDEINARARERRRVAP